MVLLISLSFKGLELSYPLLEQFIKENGRTEFHTDRANRDFLMEIAMKERLSMAKNKEQVHSDGTMDEFMKDNSKMA